MKLTSTRLAILAAATLFALPACSDRGNPTAPSAPTAVAPKSQQNVAATVPVTGTIANGGTFTGQYNITQFAVRNGQLVALGTLSGTLTDAAGAVIGTVQNIAVTLPVTQATGSCQILHLELGPLDLNLLGLQVHLDRVVLDITAQSGPGNLLGNLLCAIANLLNGGINLNILNSLVGLLNQLLQAI